MAQSFKKTSVPFGEVCILTPLGHEVIFFVHPFSYIFLRMKRGVKAFRGLEFYKVWELYRKVGSFWDLCALCLACSN
jgi:hypothetical protein